jgi:benzoyl-CoA 2,3-dioxygenase component A
MDCISPCPTGAIDNWRVVAKAYTLEQQFSWEELPRQEESVAAADGAIEALEDDVGALLAEARKGLGGKAVAPMSASKPTVNLYNRGRPATATVTGNFRLTDAAADSDVRHIILDFGDQPFPVLEGQSIGIIPPGVDAAGKPHIPRLYSVASERDGEKPNTNNLALTVKRDPGGVCSNYLCDLPRGAHVQVTGPFGATFLMPNDLHRNGIGAVPRLHGTPPPRDAAGAGTSAAVLWRQAAGRAAVFRAAAEGAGIAVDAAFLLLARAGPAAHLCAGPDSLRGPARRRAAR